MAKKTRSNPKAKKPKHATSKALVKNKLSPAAQKEIDGKLKTLAAEINTSRTESQKLCNSMTQQLIEVGRKLVEAKKLLRQKKVRGEGFYRWIETNCTFKKASAKNYMRLFKESKTHGKKMLGMGVMEAYMLAGIRHATGEPATGGAAPTFTLRDIKLPDIVPSADDKTRSLSLSRDDGFQLTLQLPTGNIEKYAKTGRTELIHHIRKALDQFLEELEEKGKPGDSKMARAGEPAVKVKDGK